MFKYALDFGTPNLTLLYQNVIHVTHTYNISCKEVNLEFIMQICVGKVTTLHLYQGAFVDIGGVHDG